MALFVTLVRASLQKDLASNVILSCYMVNYLSFGRFSGSSLSWYLLLDILRPSQTNPEETLNRIFLLAEIRYPHVNQETADHSKQKSRQRMIEVMEYINA